MPETAIDPESPSRAAVGYAATPASLAVPRAPTTLQSAPALMPAIDLDRANAQLGTAAAEDTIRWALDAFGERLVMSSSFGAHSALMLHMVQEVAPQMPVVLVDTGYLFPETYQFIEQMQARFGFRLEVFSASMSAARQEALYGRLWEQGTEGVERYLWLNKVEPMQRALQTLGVQAWIAGLRRDQSEHRRTLRRIDMQDGRIKVHPILEWSLQDIEAYLERHKLPFHPLCAQGYRSIGDWHSTLPTVEGQDPREGRILGQSQECGIHLNLSQAQADSLKSSGL
ncbi:MAG: phosphoadenylyl-sulfate reductase [Polyangiales bacterium]